MVNSQALLGKCSQPCTAAQSSAHSSTHHRAVSSGSHTSCTRMLSHQAPPSLKCKNGKDRESPIPAHSNNRKSAIKKTIEQTWNSPCPPPTPGTFSPEGGNVGQKYWWLLCRNYIKLLSKPNYYYPAQKHSDITLHGVPTLQVTIKCVQWQRQQAGFYGNTFP